MRVFCGKMVLYRWRPGQVRAQQAESAAMITKINADGTVNLKVVPDAAPDPIFLRNIAQNSNEVQSNCWLPNPDDQRLDQLETDLLEALDRLDGRAPAKKQSKLAV